MAYLVVLDVIQQQVLKRESAHAEGPARASTLTCWLCGTLRWSELAVLQVDDVQFVSAGMLLTLRRSKIDQEGAGVAKGIACEENKYTCSVRALKAWLKDAGITQGPIFRLLDR